MLTVAEVSKRLNLSERTIQRLIESGNLPAFRFGKSYRVNESELEEYINNAKVKGGENNHEV